MLTDTHPNRALVFLGMRLSEVPELQKVIPSRKERIQRIERVLRVESEISFRTF